MAFTFKRTAQQPKVSVSLTSREWEVVRKCLHIAGAPQMSFRDDIVAASAGAPWVGADEDWEEYLTGPVEEVPVNVGDEVLFDGDWLRVVAVAKNGESVAVASVGGGLLTLLPGHVEDCCPNHESVQTEEAPVPTTPPAAEYIPKVGDRVRATSTRNIVPQEVVGKVGVVLELSGCGWIDVRYEERYGSSDSWWLQDFEPAQIVGKEYIHKTRGRCTLTRNDGDTLPIVTVHATDTFLCVYDTDLTPA